MDTPGKKEPGLADLAGLVEEDEIEISAKEWAEKERWLLRSSIDGTIH